MKIKYLLLGSLLRVIILGLQLIDLEWILERKVCLMNMRTNFSKRNKIKYKEENKSCRTMRNLKGKNNF